MGQDKEMMMAYEDTQSSTTNFNSSTFRQSTDTLILFHICDFSYFGLGVMVIILFLMC